jgi:ribosomal protein S27AE
MALINCPECDKQISDKAQNCPGCGMPIIRNEPEEYLACPKCKSKELHSEKSGFSGGKALTGAVLTGGIGILAGTIGSKDIYLTCLKCNHRFKAGQALVVKPTNVLTTPELDKKIIEKYGQNENFVDSFNFYKNETNCTTNEALKHVSELLKENGFEPKKEPKKSQNTGCAGMILLFVLIGSIIYMII